MGLDDSPKYVYFSKVKSLYAAIIEDVLNQRLAIKAQ